MLKCETSWKKEAKEMDLKRKLLMLATGKVKENPFDEQVLKEVRDDFRIICKQAGAGDGLPQAGDVIQRFEIRLIQALLSAFQDPDAYFCHWWAKGTWLGSEARKLPRAPAIFDGKTKWRKYDPPPTTSTGAGRPITPP